MNKINDCVVCSFPLHGKKLRLRDFYLKLSSKVFDYTICSKCDSAIQNPMLDADEIALHYPVTYYAHRRITKRSFLDLLRDSVIKFNITNIYPNGYLNKLLVLFLHSKFKSLLPESYGDGKKFLDVNCGNGDNLRILSQYGWDTYGLEISEEHVKNLVSEGLKVSLGTIESYSTDNKYDAIRLWHVLEHFQSPLKSINKITNLLNDRGVIYLSIPIRSSLIAKCFGKYWLGYDAPRHTVAFSKKAAIEFFQNNGLQKK